MKKNKKQRVVWGDMRDLAKRATIYVRYNQEKYSHEGLDDLECEDCGVTDNIGVLLSPNGKEFDTPLCSSCIDSRKAFSAIKFC